ncbi:MAG: cyclomaltodextrinase N-terminal domain-containing protein [Alloprevotella sp.]|nr:cyclomaltodextrinase N-terminal domain-containing protein [Alloprevotella sp.]MBR1652493.1 cyclomaltodextrinase N-terminal domain-containing protein [Alloprevotella sp.]
MKRFIPVFLFVLTSSAMLFAQDFVHPSHWWAGMQNPELQVLIHAEGAGHARVSLEGAKGVKIARSVKLPNKNYALLYLNLRGAKPQQFHIRLTQADGSTSDIPYELRQRDGKPRGTWDASDVVYLIMPDRFANGDPTNDRCPSLREDDSLNGPYDSRLGGDFQGITRHLDYLDDLGVTTLWLTPTLLNDMPSYTYHGYAITDYYTMDPRYGGDEAYKEMIRATHARGMKVIQDMVFNHCGSLCPLFTDMPDTTWFNHGANYVQTNYRTGTIGDPYAAPEELAAATDGWFVRSMPDWNQRNPDVLTYLTQSSIYWIEEAGIDGIRMDTYPYTDFDAMAAWCRAVDREYPGFNIVGETWLGSNVGVSYWQKDSRLAAPRNSQLPSVMDFPLMDLLHTVTTETSSDFGKGVARLYEYLSQDAVYADPQHLLTFLENHDTDRFNATPQEAQNFRRYRQALALLLTLRGIPQLYYGSELGMSGNKRQGDGFLRRPFPGGFAGDATNAFSQASRTPQQQRYHALTSRLLQWRRHCPAAQTGRLCHFAPRDGVYVYTRTQGESRIMVAVNGTDAPRCLDLAPYRDMLAAEALDVLGGKRIQLGESLQLGVRDVVILDMTPSQNTLHQK